jgi:PAS domain S-box-containing protein
VRSDVPIVMLWGEAGTMLYNDAYSAFAGGRHPALLGMKVREAWPEVAAFNDNVMKVGLAGNTLAYRDLELALYRPGRPKQVWMNLDYSPVLDEDGMAVAVLAIVAETTERVLAERAWAEAENRVTTVLETMDEGFVLLDRDFRVRAINAGALRFENKPRSEIVGKLQSEVWPGVVGSDFGALCQKAMAARVSGTLEHFYVWPDGHGTWIEVRVYPSGDGLALFYRDVSGRRAEADRKSALLALGDRLRDVRQPDLIARAAAEIIGETLGVSQAAYARVDGDRVSILDPWLRDAGVPSVAGEQRFSEWGAYAARLHGGADVVVRDALTDALTASRRALLEAHRVRAFANIPLFGGGRMSGMIMAIDDRVRAWPEQDMAFLRGVADRTWAALQTAHAEAELVALNRDLERQVTERTAERDRVWTNAQDLFVVTDRDGIIRAANPAWTTILGWRPEEVVGRHHLSMNHPDHRAPSEAARLRAAAQERVPVYETRVLHKDGSDRIIAWVAAGEGDQVYASGRDVTEERAAAEELARTQDLLRQSQKMEAVGQLTGGIAHDFNNLLGAITGSLELLQLRVAAGRLDGVERYTSAAIGAAQRAAGLTQRLLAFARRQPLDPKRVDGNRLLAGMEELLRRTLGPGIELELVLADGLWPTLCDPNQLESAVLNLAINARDAMTGGQDAGRGWLVIETTNEVLDEAAARRQGADARPGEYVVVSVTDSGAGMPPEIMAKVFDPFFTTKPIGQGTGLGLSMLYGFIRQSEGHVRVSSELGVGTVFRLYLPRLVVEDEAEAGDAARLDAAEAAASVGETVLIVDDEPVLRMLVTETLQDLGYDALEAGDAAAALQVIDSPARIDLLVTDVGLPGMNGRQLADAARALRPGLRVLFITGYAHHAAIGQGDALEHGTEIMVKPFALDALAGRVRDMIGAR